MNEKFDARKIACDLQTELYFLHRESVEPNPVALIRVALEKAFAAGQVHPKGKSWEMWAVMKGNGELFVDSYKDVSITTSLERVNKIHAPSAGERPIRVRVTLMEE